MLRPLRVNGRRLIDVIGAATRSLGDLYLTLAELMGL
jgi:hypothetical protein